MNEIKSVKISGQGYAVDYGDGVIWYVSIDGCGYDKVLKWIEDGNTPEPEFTEEELAQKAIDKTNSEARQTLAQGDWKVIRELERLMLKNTELNTEREALRASVMEVTNG